MPPREVRAAAARVLGVAEDASLGEIRRAYHRLALELHPDQAGPARREEWNRVVDAYEVLSGKRERNLKDPARAFVEQMDPLFRAGIDGLSERLKKRMASAAPETFVGRVTTKLTPVVDVLAEALKDEARRRLEDLCRSDRTNKS